MGDTWRALGQVYLFFLSIYFKVGVWHMSIIPTFWRVKPEDCSKIKASLSYIEVSRPT